MQRYSRQRGKAHAVGCLAAAQDAGRPALCAPAPCVARTIPVGNMPVALTVDTRTQRAFVRNGDGTVSVLDLTHGTTLRTVVVSKPDADHNRTRAPRQVIALPAMAIPPRGLVAARDPHVIRRQHCGRIRNRSQPYLSRRHAYP
jgi:hypothetical protein